MYRKDYIQRQFEEFGKVLANLLQLKRKKNWDEFEKEMSVAFLTFAALNDEELEKLTLESFVNNILHSDKLSFQQKKFVANLLFEKMNSHLERNNQQAYEDLRNKCYMLYKKLQQDQTENEFDLDIHYKLKQLED